MNPNQQTALDFLINESNQCQCGIIQIVGSLARLENSNSITDSYNKLTNLEEVQVIEKFVVHLFNQEKLKGRAE